VNTRFEIELIPQLMTARTDSTAYESDLTDSLDGSLYPETSRLSAPELVV